jgi:hypothetical protein
LSILINFKRNVVLTRGEEKVHFAVSLAF